MTKTNAEMVTAVELAITTNGLKENTGARVRQVALDWLAREGQANGLATLNAGGRVAQDSNYIPAGSTSVAGSLQTAIRSLLPTIPYGAVADSAYTFATGVWSGTDNHDTIQDALDVHVYENIGPSAFLPVGNFKVNRGLHLGHGSGFDSGVFEGAKRGYSHDVSGSRLIANFNDEPLISIQGARASRVKKLTLVGLNRKHIDDTDCGGTTPTGDDTVASFWKGPSLGTNSDSRYAPYAGIATDPYSGVEPSPSYPDYARPTQIASFTKYGRNFSSDIHIEDVEVQGFWVAVVVTPSNALGNGDFVTWTGGLVTHCVYGVAICQTQSRLSKIENVYFSTGHTALTSNKFGQQQGKFADTINCQFAGYIQIYDFHTLSVAGPINIIGCYSEALWRIGTFSTSTASETGIQHIGCGFQFSLQTPNTLRGIPASTVQGGSQSARVSFENCSFTSYWSVVVFDIVAGLEIKGGMFQPNSAQRTLIYQKTAHNALMGGIMLRNLGQAGYDPEKILPRWIYYNLNTGAEVGSTEQRRVHASSRTICTPFWAKYHQGADGDECRASATRINVVAVGSLSSSVLTDETWTFTYAALTDDLAMIRGFLPGDVLYHDDSDTVFFVSARSGDDITAVMQNNYKSDGAGGYTPRSLNLAAGNIYNGNARHYHPATAAVYGTFTSGSAIITDVGTLGGSSTHLESDIVVGDYIARSVTIAQFISETNSRITARDNAAKTITLAGNAGASSFGRVRIESFIRTAPT